jgi:outer membrane protein W
MKQITLSLIFAGLFAVPVVHTANGQIDIAETAPRPWFFRAVALYAEPTESGASGAGGFGLTFGQNFGANREHEMSADWFYVDFTETAHISGFSASGSVLVMPSVASYRYRFGQLGSAARPYLGLSAGMAVTRVSLSGSGPGGSFSASDTKSSFAGGLQAGVSFPVSDRLDAEVGYRYMFTSSSNFNFFGESFRSGTSKAHVGHAGLALRF